jgi:hypothetical protein
MERSQKVAHPFVDVLGSNRLLLESSSVRAGGTPACTEAATHSSDFIIALLSRNYRAFKRGTGRDRGVIDAIKM